MTIVASRFDETATRKIDSTGADVVLHGLAAGADIGTVDCGGCDGCVCVIS